MPGLGCWQLGRYAFNWVSALDLSVFIPASAGRCAAFHRSLPVGKEMEWGDGKLCF